jgi:hypothetical protein
VTLNAQPDQAQRYHCEHALRVGIQLHFESSAFFFLPPKRACAAFYAISLRRAGDNFLLRIATIACATAFFFAIAAIIAHGSQAVSMARIHSRV